MSAVIVISGPGGAGKGTIVDRILQEIPSICLSRSWTTRDRRPGEPEDAYHFKTEGEFQANIEQGGFLEWVQFLDYRQGSPIPDPSRVTLFEIDSKGAQTIKELYPDALTIGIIPPGMTIDEQLDALSQRLDGRRSETPESKAKRLGIAQEEMDRLREAGSHLVVNDDLERAVDETADLIRRHLSTT